MVWSQKCVPKCVLVDSKAQFCAKKVSKPQNFRVLWAPFGCRRLRRLPPPTKKTHAKNALSQKKAFPKVGKKSAKKRQKGKKAQKKRKKALNPENQKKAQKKQD